MHPYIHWSAIYNSQDLEAAQVPISRWVDKTTMGHLHSGVLLGFKKRKKGNLTLCNSIILSEISQSEKDRNWFHLYVESNKQNKQNRNRLIDTENRLTAVRGRGVGKMGGKGEGIKEKTSQTQTIVWWLKREGKVGGGRRGSSGDKRRWKETWLGVVNTQYTDNVCRIVNLKPI